MTTSFLFNLAPTDLISPAYCAEQKILHARPKGYGGKGNKWTHGVCDLVARYGCSSVLDYGCGQATLSAELRPLLPGIRVDDYDPAIPGKDRLPSFADLVVCTDVLEHVEPERLDRVLRHLDVLARRIIFLVVATRPSNKTLSDGRNAHLIVEPAEWWMERITSLIQLPIAEGPKSPLKKLSREWVGVLLR